MTLQRFLLGVGESRWFWLGLRRWKPGATQRWSAATALAHALRLGVVAALVGGALTWASWQTSFRGSWWPMRWVLGLAAVLACVMIPMLAVAWNRRAGVVARGPATPGEPLPALRGWQRWLLGPLYALVFFVATPLLLWSSLGNATGAWAWERARAAMQARGVPLTIAELVPAAPPNDENLAQTPLLRPLLAYSLVVTNGKTEAVWEDRPGYLRAQAFVDLPSPIREARPVAGREARRSPATNQQASLSEARPAETKKEQRVATTGRYDLLALARGIRARPLRSEFPGFPAEGTVAPQPLAAAEVESAFPPGVAKRFGISPGAKPALTTDEARALTLEDPAGEVLRFLERYEPEMAELSAASRRPRCQFAAHWEDGELLLLPHLSPLKGASTLFRVRAAARLAKDDPAGAHADTLTTLRLGRAFAEEPVLMSHLVYVAQQTLGIATAWEGLVARRWNDAQIAAVQDLVSAIDVSNSLRLAYQGERIFANLMVERMLRDPARPESLRSGDTGDLAVGSSPAGPPHFLGLRPVGILRRNQVAWNRLYDVILDQVQDPSWPANLVTPRPDPQRDDESLFARAGLRPVHPDNVLAAMLGPAVTRAQTKTARLAATARMAETACALERYRLRTGKYPESLEALVPRELHALPLDPMNHQPLMYQPTSDGWFRLWSVGLDGRDGGGVMSEDPDRAAGDWVWPSPVLSAERRLF